MVLVHFEGWLGNSRGERRWLGTAVMMMMTTVGVCIYYVEGCTLLERHACSFAVSMVRYTVGVE